MTDLNEELLSEDPNSQAVEADENVYYTPKPDEESGVVVTEPDIITMGRKLRRDAVRDLPPEQRG